MNNETPEENRSRLDRAYKDLLRRTDEDMGAMRPKDNRASGWLHRMFGIFGYAIIPIREIEQLEKDSVSDYEVMKRYGISEINKGYFNGLADMASKTAHRWRALYIPNAEVSDGGPLTTPRIKRTPAVR
jgi:hypothetical protein